MKKKHVVKVLAGAVAFTAISMASIALAATALVPHGTSMNTMTGPGNTTLSISGLKLKSLSVYHHDGRNNTVYSAADLGGGEQGPYSVVLEKSKNQTALYGFAGDAFNFEHYTMETNDAGKTCEVARWAHITGTECLNGCPAYMGFNPQTKEGIISVPVRWRGKNVAEYTAYSHLTPAAQKAFMDMVNGKSVMPPIQVR